MDDDEASDSGTRLRFAPFTFDVTSGELVGDHGVVVRLEPQPAKVLALLAGRAGQLVTREALQREVWPDGTFVDFERGLNYCVAKIRAALGDDAARPRFVETLPRRGYRFVAAVASTPGAPLEPPGRGPDASPAAPEVTRRADPPMARPAAPPAGAILALVVALATAFAVIAWFARHPTAEKPTIAVARFDNETGRGELERQAQSLTDSIVLGLTRPPGAWEVIGNAAILRAPRSFRDLGAIRSALDADAIILGQVRESDGRFLVLVHLIRARDEKHLWANQFPVEEGGWAGVERSVVAAMRAAAEAQRGAFR